MFVYDTRITLDNIDIKRIHGMINRRKQEGVRKMLKEERHQKIVDLLNIEQKLSPAI